MFCNLFVSFLFSFFSTHFFSDALNINDISFSKVAHTNLRIPEKKVFENVYDNLTKGTFEVPNFDVFSKALKGFYIMKEKGFVQKNILTLIDFSLSANSQRLWVIDLDLNTILYHSLVAHGRNSGEEFAESFSNEVSSYKSSLGFYATGELYTGKHGLSLRLDGVEKGLNDNARKRAVVIHGADYVSDDFIKENKRLGRSLGCPALPVGLSDQIVEAIKDKTCLFIYHPSNTNEVLSKFFS